MKLVFELGYEKFFIEADSNPNLFGFISALALIKKCEQKGYGRDAKYAKTEAIVIDFRFVPDASFEPEVTVETDQPKEIPVDPAPSRDDLIF